MELSKIAEKLVTEDCPFAQFPKSRKAARWLRPVLVGKIQYIEWTASGTLRQPVIQSLVDFDPKFCMWPGEIPAPKS